MSQQEQGPPMICATRVMRPGPTRIGRLGGITFPRTVSVLTLFASGGGALVGVIAALAVHPGLSSFVYGAAFGGGAGWLLVTYSPLKGESTLKWLELQFNTARRGRYINGERVTLGIGTAPLPRAPRGPVALLRSAVPVRGSQYDERGVLVSPTNRNLPEAGTIDPLLFAALSLPGEGGTSLTPVAGLALGEASNRGRRPARGAPAPAQAPAQDPTPAAPVGKPRRLKD